MLGFGVQKHFWVEALGLGIDFKGEGACSGFGDPKPETTVRLE